MLRIATSTHLHQIQRLVVIGGSTDGRWTLCVCRYAFSSCRAEGAYHANRWRLCITALRLSWYQPIIDQVQDGHLPQRFSGAEGIFLMGFTIDLESLYVLYNSQRPTPWTLKSSLHLFPRNFFFRACALVCHGSQQPLDKPYDFHVRGRKELYASWSVQGS